ncbi:hypothetical protein SAMN05216276_1001160 [Streptosporangium subroseum]|uniref:Uncharacterized protein n=1 Tax=Streptosporangium subroseum TaxID=106412 RepID=A0A239A6P1_9ACTN|nr:hypothetical protein [Streptosporangium subroseum]SNR91159.1 hypothetical protein SAMN05216276_1001160 [Streptosporangium subroseum]
MPVRGARSVAVPAAALLAVTLLGGCAGDQTTTANPEIAATRNSAPAPDLPDPGVPPAAGAPAVEADREYDGECPATANARPFAKTRFALHAGLALGAFYRYIYRPLRSGGFERGAPRRKRNFLKAAAAGAFTLHELRVARRFAMANPTLCKGTKAVSDSFDNLLGKLKNGTATQADLDASMRSFESLRENASKNGYNFKERNVTVPSAS